METRQRAKLTGTNCPIELKTSHAWKSSSACTQQILGSNPEDKQPEPGFSPIRMGWMTWWLWRGARTRSHPELGRENPQRPWYCVSRRGRVGRRQVFQPIRFPLDAGWSSPVARQAHNLKVRGSNPLPATNFTCSANESSPSPLVAGFLLSAASARMPASAPLRSTRSSPPSRRQPDLV